MAEGIGGELEGAKIPAIETQKEQHWQEVKKEFIKDKLGHESDAGIVDTVVGLNVLGVNTDKSCEGHIDSGGVPYIDAKAKDTLGIEQIYEMSVKEETRDTAKKLSEETTRLNLKEREKLMGYLNDFYQNRQVPYETRLSIQSNPLGVTRLESQGAGLQGIVVPEIKQQRLQAYQEEMRAFGEFLKNTYFSGAKIPAISIPSVVPIKPEGQRIVETPPAEKKMGLDEQVAKLELAYEFEMEHGGAAMTPFWLACAQVMSSPPDVTRPVTRQCNLARVKDMLDAAAEELVQDGYRRNRYKTMPSFNGPKPIYQTRKEVARSIEELTGYLGSDDDVDQQEQIVDKELMDLNNRFSYGDIPFQLHPASFHVVEHHKPKWDSLAADKVAWIVIGHALAQYIQGHYSRLLKV